MIVDEATATALQIQLSSLSAMSLEDLLDVMRRKVRWIDLHCESSYWELSIVDLNGQTLNFRGTTSYILKDFLRMKLHDLRKKELAQ